MRKAGELRLRRGLAGVAMVVVGAALLVPAGASARPRPTVSLSFTNASEGAPISFTWSARHIGRGTSLVLQRPVGTSHVWKTIGRMTRLSGSAHLASGLSLGQYRYRIAALRGRWVLAQQVATANVFGQVPFSTLFQGSEHLDNGVYATPTGSFPYVSFREGLPNTEKGEAPTTLFSVTRNNCSTAHVVFAIANYFTGKTPTATGTLALVQQSRDPVSASAPLNGTGSVDAELVPGQTWSVIASVVGHEEPEAGTAELEPIIYLNGYAICDSTEPFGS